MRKTTRGLLVLLLAGLSMGYGWGWRGDYGHELGAALPGALVAMAVCLAAGRRDWWDRCLVLGLFGAFGWAFGGSQSYGVVLGYTLHAKFWGVAYGFACLFLIAALWGAIGGGFLGLALSRSRRELNGFIGPWILIAVVWAAFRLNGVTAWSEDWAPFRMYDVDWLAALSALVVAGAYASIRQSNEAKLLALMALGWWVGFVLLTLALGLRMTPPRSDNWAGILGVAVVVWGYLTVNRERAARVVLAYGGLFGGLGFCIGALFLSLQIAYGWPISGWRLMEQFFGLVMGLGTGIAVLKLAAHEVAQPEEGDASPGSLNAVALLVLFPGILGLNFRNNIQGWLKYGENRPDPILAERTLGVPTLAWFILVGVLGTLLLGWAFRRHRRAPLPVVPGHPLGRGQLVFLVFLWLSVAAAFSQKVPWLAGPGAFFSQFTFGILALACTFVVLSVPSSAIEVALPDPPSHRHWRLGGVYWALWIAVPVIILLLTQAAVTVHPEPIPGSHYRFTGPQVD